MGMRGHVITNNEVGFDKINIAKSYVNPVRRRRRDDDASDISL